MASSLFQQGLRSNFPLLGTAAFTLLLQMATIYVPQLNPIFSATPLTAQELMFCLALSIIVFFMAELEKLFVRKGWLYAQPS